MKKHDFKKLAVLGLASGLLASTSSVEAIDFSSTLPIAHTGCGGKNGCGHYSNPNGQGSGEVAEADEDFSTGSDRVQSGCPQRSGPNGQYQTNSNPNTNSNNPNRNPRTQTNNQQAYDQQSTQGFRRQGSNNSQNAQADRGQQGYNSSCGANSSSNGQKTYTR